MGNLDDVDDAGFQGRSWNKGLWNREKSQDDFKDARWGWLCVDGRQWFLVWCNVPLECARSVQ